MPELTDEQIKEHTLKWIHSFIIDHNICPFAKHPLKQQSLSIKVVSSNDIEKSLEALMAMITILDNAPEVETALLIFPHFLSEFDDYLEFASMAEELLTVSNYEGIYQLATFHPNYCFADVLPADVSNYTNRSPYPMLHILRESSIEKAIEYYGDTSQIPDDNIEKMHELGLEKVTALLKNLI